MPTPNNGFAVVSRQIKTTFVEDTFPLVEDKDLLGGFLTVPNAAALQSVPLPRQKKGMTGITQDTFLSYYLQTPGSSPVWVLNDYATNPNVAAEIAAAIAEADATIISSINAQVVTNISALQALNITNTTFAPYAIVRGNTTPGDGGGGTFVYVPGDTTTVDNGGTIIVDALGRRWYRQYSGAPDPRWFGLVAGDNTKGAANLAAITATLALAQGIEYPVGTIYISGGSIAHTGSGFVARGKGKGFTNIVQQTNNTPILLLNGTRMHITEMQLSYANIQTSAHTLSSAIKVVASASGGILGTSLVDNINIVNCGVGVDLKASQGYQTRFQVSVTGFSISAVQCDGTTGWTQLDLDIYQQNQPSGALTGTAVSGSTTTIQLPSSASAVDSFYKGMPFNITGGTGAGSTVYWITGYVGATKTATFTPAASGVDATSQFNIAQTIASTDYPMNIQGITDVKLKYAMEFLQLATVAPLFLQTVRQAIIEDSRQERVTYTQNNSALMFVSGACDLTVLSSANEFCPILTELGVTTFFLSRTSASATTRFVKSPQFNNMTVDSAIKWALCSGTRTLQPFGGTYFDTLPSGDGTVAPSGFTQDNPGPNNQTAIMGRPPAAARGVVLDAGDADYTHNMMSGPEEIRYNTAITANRVVHLDTANLIAGEQVGVVRDVGCTGAFNITVQASATVRATLYGPGSGVILYCDGGTYRLLVYGSPPIEASQAYTPPSLTAVTGGAITAVTVTGATFGDSAVATFSADLAGYQLFATVSAANTVKVTPFNPTAGTLTPSAGTLTVRVNKQ